MFHRLCHQRIYLLAFLLTGASYSLAEDINISVGGNALAPVDYSISTEVTPGRNIGVSVGISTTPASAGGFNPFRTTDTITPGLNLSLSDYSIKATLLTGPNTGNEFLNAEWVNGVNTLCTSSFITPSISCDDIDMSSVFSTGGGLSLGEDYRVDINVSEISIDVTALLSPGTYPFIIGSAVTAFNELWNPLPYRNFTINLEDRTCTITPIETLSMGTLRKGEVKTSDVNLFFDCDGALSGASWLFSERDNIALSGVNIELLDSSDTLLTAGTRYSDVSMLNRLRVRASASTTSSTGQFSKSFLFTVSYL
ncbi:hypothetical protein D8S93_23525 [Vibrio sp. VGrn 2]|uniref:hypothetical protein n=1 Tax=Vibrio sp. VGrn 2 TaxID=2419839 RepID=UPI00128CF886|nr:hypothetical protein [Vibrio sp. VGrn 2]MPS41555.1 hypothetical protein [Vibrio sp. VGrn 2]